MGLFGSKKSQSCAVCKKESSSTSKPKKEWNLKGVVCTDCFVKLMKKPHPKITNPDDKCVSCGAEPGGLYLWKPKKEWELKGWLCEPCYNEREKADNESKKNCVLCNAKLGFVARRAKKEWNVKGYICKECWKIQESKLGTS